MRMRIGLKSSHVFVRLASLRMRVHPTVPFNVKARRSVSSLRVFAVVVFGSYAIHIENLRSARVKTEEA